MYAVVLVADEIIAVAVEVAVNVDILIFVFEVVRTALVIF